MDYQASLIHIGLAKTATTSLQRNLLAGHLEIYHFGFVNCELGMQWVLRMIKSQDSMDYRQTRVSHLMDGIFKREPLGNKKLVVSDEFLTLPFHPEYPSVDRAMIGRRLLDTFGQSKILLVIRRPQDLLGALYSEWMQWYGTYHMSTADFNVWVTDMLNRPATTWLSLLKYYDIYQLYGQIFGADNMMLCLYEDIEKDNDAFAEKVCNYIGVSQEGAGELFAKKRFRSRLKQWQVQEKMIFAPHPRMWRIYHNHIKRRPINFLMNRFLSGKQTGAHLSVQNADRINQRFSSQYRKLDSVIGLNLKDCGYYW